MRARDFVVCFAALTGVFACGGDELGEKTGALCPPDSTISYQADIAPFMTSYCTSCHSSKLSGKQRHDAPGDHNFDTEAGILEFADEVDREAGASGTVVNTKMPEKPFPEPSVADRMKLSEWLACNPQ